MEAIIIPLVIWVILPVPLAILWLRGRSRQNLLEVNLEAMKERFEPIISIEHEVNAQHDKLQECKRNLDDIKMDYTKKREVYDNLKAQIAIYNEKLSFAELGMYEPHFNFDDSEKYREQISEIRDEQKNMISAKAAAICPAEWTVEGSRSKGKTMINRQLRLTLRAFNTRIIHKGCRAA